MAWFKRNPGPKAGLIFHSDRGSQYASDDFSEVLKGHAITPSMSGKGNCWDTQSNIPSERRPGLTRAGTGQAAFALTCRSCSGVL
jgi:putative transposase